MAVRRTREVIIRLPDGEYHLARKADGSKYLYFWTEDPRVYISLDMDLLEEIMKTFKEDELWL